jgi:DNA-directed RNA polymerase specialized sigma24 family protein
MVALAQRDCSPKSSPAWHGLFLAMLPRIIAYARIAFRGFGPDATADAIQEVVANAFVAFARLAELGKTAVARPTPLAMYATRQYREGRRVGNQRNVCDVLSSYCQREKGVTVQRLDHFNDEENGWCEIVVEDRRAGPAETAAVRMDFGDWLASLPRRNRKIAQMLAVGHSTSEVAKRFDVSLGRISQMRRELADSWQAFQGQTATADTAA